MLNSLVLMFSQYDKNRKVATIFKIFWVLYAIASSFFNLLFSAINTSAFLLMTGIIHYISKISHKINAILSVCSILIDSLFIDIICYYILPSWAEGQSLIQYITNGFLFNYKYVFVNTAAFALTVLRSKLFKVIRLENLQINKIYNNKCCTSS